MSDPPLNPLVELSPAEAETVLRQWLGRDVKCLAVRRLTGGCVRTVLEIAFEGPESPAVLKLAHEAGDDTICREFEVLRYYRAHTSFPVPEPFLCDSSGERLPYSYLVMERVPGRHLGEAAPEFTSRQHVDLQRAMAEAVAALHTHTGPRFGDAAGGEGHSNWAQHVAEDMLDLYRENERVGLLSADAMARVRRIADAVPGLLDAPGEQTLVHGDIWATNIMVNDGRLAGFLDPGGRLAHREYELAYLEIWRTADSVFFDVYHEVHPRLDGYERRRLAYWLNTLLLHVWLFQSDNYVRAAEQLVSRFVL